MRYLVGLPLLLPLVSAGVFPKDSLVQMLDAKSFKKAMKANNESSMVAFVAPWCGHCQRMAPEYSKAALGLHPLIPFYAVDCDADQNKRLCAEQGVQGFPTVKMFPRGDKETPVTYEGERSASAFYYFVTRRIPPTFTKLYKTQDILPWIEKTKDEKRTLLLTKDKKVPLLWKILSNKYEGKIQFGTHRDRKGKSSVALGFEAGEKKQSKVLFYSPGSTKPFRYEGLNKFESLSKFFDAVLDGTADLTVANAEAKAEEEQYEPTEEELEIQRKQEAQRMALLHGGFADLVDFEQAILSGNADSYHDTNGFGSPPPLKKKKKEEAATEPVDSEPVAEKVEAVPTNEESKVAKDEAEL
ncbi:Protein disulfide isomerase [Mycena indigotica]|uniref:Protein disulfide isomerase n=1 Tax=Mycena indigotica TaxID=2126181 RepID=A0A8H6T258_9AGAR|nr:Protein disulfide isomerase [Mycena indigotica]KAF7309480.1 Protein disulfide isomerase [Mycena indigotica]